MHGLQCNLSVLTVSTEAGMLNRALNACRRRCVMRKRHVVPAVLIAGLGFLGSLAGASPGRAQDWICQELEGSQCYYPSTIFCYWSEEEIGVCDCQEDP